MTQQKAYIFSLNGKPWNKECEIAMQGFREMGIETVLFSNTDQLKQANKEDIIVAGMMVTSSYLTDLGIEPVIINYPESLHKYLGRQIWTTTVKNLEKQSVPYFTKPLSEKLAPGIVIRSLDDLHVYKTLEKNSVMLCSEPVEFVSEWRFYVVNRQLLGVSFYKGDLALKCNSNVVSAAINEYTEGPANYAIDFGVTNDGRTLLIEVNDGYAIGCYELEDVLYAKFLKARWDEIISIYGNAIP